MSTNVSAHAGMSSGAENFLNHGYEDVYYYTLSKHCPLPSVDLTMDFNKITIYYGCIS